MLSRTWLVLFCRRLCLVTQGLAGPLHRVCCAAPSVLWVRCRTAWCCASHCVCLAALHLWAVGCGQWNFCYALRLPLSLGAVGSATPAMHCITACGQCAVELLLCTATLSRGSGLSNLWAVEFLQHTASLPWGSGQWNSYHPLPHCLGVVGRATPAIHCHTAWGRWAVELLQFAGPSPGGMGMPA